jgi:Domain of unknown function (DUF4349)
MTNHTKDRFLNIVKIAFGVFLFLFIFRFCYGYITPTENQNQGTSDSFFSQIGSIRKNYASEKRSMKADVQLASNLAGQQKFEKTASIKAKSSKFEQDEQQIKQKTKDFEAVIQYEQSLGQKDSRQIHLIIGVNPTLFDSFYVAMQAVGVTQGLEITKVDKTNEYRQLNAKKTSIEKTLQSLLELKSKGGQIADFVALNDKILEIEEKAQELGVELGNFDSENEFCTVKFSLFEGAEQRGVSLMQRIKVALEWTIKYFTMLMVAALACSAFAFFFLRLFDRMTKGVQD